MLYLIINTSYKKDMRICHITTAHSRYDSRILWKECASLAEAGHEVFLIVNDDLEDEIADGVNIVSINCPTQGRISRIISNKIKNKAYEKAMEIDAEVYQFHDPELLSVGNKLNKNGKRVVYDIHEDYPRQIMEKEWIPKLLRPIIASLYERYENYSVKKYNALVVPTPHIKERFETLNKNVVEVCNFPSTSDIIFSGDNYSVDNPVCYVGGLSYTRGIIQIAEATQGLGLTLNICGPFHSKGLQDEIEKNYENVNYLGMLDRQGVSNLLNRSSIGLVTLLDTPNDAMAYPIKLFEYMAAGIPIVASDFPVYKGIIEKYNCGICVNPLDIDAISKAINEIKSNIDYANQLRQNGYRAVLDSFNWHSQAEQLLELYTFLVKE